VKATDSSSHRDEVAERDTSSKPPKRATPSRAQAASAIFRASLVQTSAALRPFTSVPRVGIPLGWQLLPPALARGQGCKRMHPKFKKDENTIFRISLAWRVGSGFHFSRGLSKESKQSSPLGLVLDGSGWRHAHCRKEERKTNMFNQSRQSHRLTGTDAKTHPAHPSVPLGNWVRF
jgi:hypothetical protein